MLRLGLGAEQAHGCSAFRAANARRYYHANNKSYVAIPFRSGGDFFQLRRQRHPGQRVNDYTDGAYREITRIWRDDYWTGLIASFTAAIATSSAT